MPYVAYTVAKPSAAVNTGYSTTWPATENPISESAAWRRPGPSVFTNNMRSVAGTGVFGGSGASGVNDACAVLTGTNFLFNKQVATATIYNPGGAAAAGIEMEFHLNVTDTSSTVNLYEFDLVVNPGNDFVNVVKWRGTQGDIYLFSGGDIIAGTGVATAGAWSDGSVLEATSEKVGSNRILTLQQNGALIIQVQDTGIAQSGLAIYTTGNPGIGGDNGGASFQTFGFKNYSVVTS